MEKDIFCKIIEGEQSADMIYHDDNVIAIGDIHPQAPVHILIIPRKHIDEIYENGHENLDILGEMMVVAGKVAKLAGVEKSGYRLIINQGSDGGQLVRHLHMHLLGGKKLGLKIVK